MGPLSGVKIVEFAGLGPGPFAAMLMADLGANIVRVVRPGEGGDASGDPVMRGRSVLALDLKRGEDVGRAMSLVALADGLIEGFRPGVMESLGLGPNDCHRRNSRLVYARMTGWGQTGPLAARAGHDINYIALAGALDRIGRRGQPPTVPMNLIGDYGGGALYLAFGMVSALLDARATGAGQTLDVAMVDGVASLLAKQFGFLAAGKINPGRAQNLLDGGAPFYDVYECADGGFVAVGAIEDKFYELLLQGLEFDPHSIPARHERARWDDLRALFAARFKTRSRDEWARVFEGSDACVTPVLSMDEAKRHPHFAARGTFQSLAHVVQPGAAPRFSKMTARTLADATEADFEGTLRAWGAAAPIRPTNQTKGD